MAPNRDIPSFGEFDLAIVNALKKNPQGLRYSDLYRKSSREYNMLQPSLRNQMDRESDRKDENTINIKTFDKHLKRLVKEGVLERIEEKRSKVFYKLMIPEDSFPKRYVANAREWLVPFIVSVAKRVRETDRIDESKVETLMDDLIPHLVKDSLVKAIRLYRENPSWARYLVDESTELTRNMINEIAMILGDDEETQGKVTQTIMRLRREGGKRENRKMRENSKGKILPISNFTIDLNKIEGQGDFDCPRCKTHISPEDDTEKAYSVIDTELREADEGPKLNALIVKCQMCKAIIKIEGF